eukprot:6487020-Amphidinium_carterae.2
MLLPMFAKLPLASSCLRESSMRACQVKSRSSSLAAVLDSLALRVSRNGFQVMDLKAALLAIRDARRKEVRHKLVLDWGEALVCW